MLLGQSQYLSSHKFLVTSPFITSKLQYFKSSLRTMIYFSVQKTLIEQRILLRPIVISSPLSLPIQSTNSYSYPYYHLHPSYSLHPFGHHIHHLTNSPIPMFLSYPPPQPHGPPTKEGGLHTPTLPSILNINVLFSKDQTIYF